MLREQRLSRMLLARLSPKPLMRDNNVYVNSSRSQRPWSEPAGGVIVFFLQIDTVVLKKSNRDKHLQNWLSSTPRAFGAD